MRTEKTLDQLCEQLQRNCGDMLAACQAVGVSLIFVEQWRKDDSKVNERLVEAERVGTQGLVSAAIQRAVHGVEKGVYYKGVRVDTEVQYSDSLLTTLLKAKVDEFKKEDGGGGVNVNVNVANIMPRAENYEQWLAMKTATLNPPAPALEDKTQDAEFVSINTPEFAGIEL